MTKLQLLYWLRGWAYLLDGLAAIVTLGFYRPDLSTDMSGKILMEMFRNDT